MLTEQQIPTPGTLEYCRTGSTRRYHLGYECKWATNTVVHILENREYTGCLVNFKTEKLSYKVKHSVENPTEKQVIFENHHEPIICLLYTSGYYNSDMEDYIRTKLLESLFKFRLDR